MQQLQDRDQINWIQRSGGINKNTFLCEQAALVDLTLVSTRVFLARVGSLI